jgi:hypothetical protein
MRSFVKLLGAVLVAAGAGLLAASLTSSSTPKTGTVTASALMSPAEDEIFIDNGLVAVTSGFGNLCTTKLLNATSLEVVRTVDSCPDEGTNENLVVDEGRLGLEVHVMATNTRTPGPLLMTIQNWSWAHSSVAEGDGAVWIYGLSGSSGPSTLLDVSSATGRVRHRFSVEAGASPYLFVDDDGLWITPSAWGGSSCSGSCTLWRVSPGSDRLVPVRQLSVRTQWLMASGHSIYADVLTTITGGWQQTIWRLDGPDAVVAYKTPATALPSTDFAPLTGYVVVGNAQQGYFTLTQLGQGTTPAGTGDCDTSAPIRVVRIDPATGRQSYVATIPRSIAGSQLDCHLVERQGLFYDGAFYVLAGQWSQIPNYQRVVRVAT